MQFPPRRSIEFARAKLNLSLDVLGSRSDGYHELAGLMTTIDLADRLDLSIRRLTQQDRGWEITADSERVPQNESNLCYKAAHLFFEKAGAPPGSLHFSCHIRKKIPMAAGLGGGSADAAAVLRFLWMCWRQGLAAAYRLDHKRLSLDDLEGVALICGADVPFCLYGGVRYCQGVGERMSGAIGSPAYPLLLAFPPQAVRTADAFRLLDASRLDRDGGIPAFRQAAASGAQWAAALEKDDRPGIGVMAANDFLEIRSDQTELSDLLIEDMRKTGAFAASMTGSGPACFGLYPDSRKLERAFRTLSEAYPAVSWAMSGLSPRPEKLDGQN